MASASQKKLHIVWKWLGLYKSQHLNNSIADSNGTENLWRIDNIDVLRMQLYHKMQLSVSATSSRCMLKPTAHCMIYLNNGIADLNGTVSENLYIDVLWIHIMQLAVSDIWKVHAKTNCMHIVWATVVSSKIVQVTIFQQWYCWSKWNCAWERLMIRTQMYYLDTNAIVAQNAASCTSKDRHLAGAC